MAKELKIEQDSGRLSISYSWRTSGMWFLVLWCVIWDIGMVAAITSGAGLFVSLHVLAGIMVTWLTLTRFFNQTTITVDRSAMKVDHGPIPWPFAKKHNIPARSLKQLYVDKSAVSKNKQATYALMAILDTGAEVKILDAEPDITIVQGLERTIEDYLDIANDTSLDLSSSGKKPEELKAMYKQVKSMREAAEGRSWMPDFVKEKLIQQEAMLEREMANAGHMDVPLPGQTSAPSSSRPSSPSSRPLNDDAVTIRTAPGAPRPLPTPDHDFDFPLYLQAEGCAVKFNDVPYQLGRTAQIDWTDTHSTTARQLELRPNGSGDNLYFFTQLERERWAYYEERRLDDGEVFALGFTSEMHPLRFDNGDERYYPRDLQTGLRFIGQAGHNVQQYIYFTTSSTAQFRALKPEGGDWEVYVMEPVDSGAFEG